MNLLAVGIVAIGIGYWMFSSGPSSAIQTTDGWQQAVASGNVSTGTMAIQTTDGWQQAVASGNVSTGTMTRQLY